MPNFIFILTLAFNLYPRGIQESGKKMLSWVNVWLFLKSEQLYG